MSNKKPPTGQGYPVKPMGIAYLVGRLDRILNKNLRNCLMPLGLTVPQYTALSVFRTHGSMSNAQLAERTLVSPQSANELVKNLESRGWIERLPDPAHGKIIRISLTEEGERLLARCDEQVREIELAMLPDLNEAELQQLQNQLRAAVRALTVRTI